VSVRLFNEGYLKCGFMSCANKNKNSKLKCVVFNEVIANESLKPSKLKRHLETQHAQLIGKILQYYQRRKQELSYQHNF
jgi:hypothetical protein